MAAALRIRAVRELTGLYVLAFVLEWFSTVALMVLVYDASNSALAATAMLLSRQIAPVLVVPALTERIAAVPPRVALFATLLMVALAACGVATLGYGVWLFPLAAVAGTAGVLFRATVRGTMSQALDGPLLRQANAVMNILVAVAAAAGPALAAWAVVATGASGALWIAAVATGALALAALMVFPNSPQGTGGFVPDGSELQDADQPPRRSDAIPYPLLLGMAGVVMCMCAMDEPALLAYSRDSLGAGVAGYGAIYVAWGAGALIGSLIFSRLLSRSMLAITAASGLTVGLAYLGMGLSTGIVVSCLLAVLGGAGNGAGFVALVTAVQEAADPGAEVRAAARFETVATAAPGIGIVLGGLMTELAGPRFALAVPGAVCLAVIVGAVAAARLRSAHAPFGATVRLSPTTPGGTV